MQFVMYTGKLHIYQHSFFITYDIHISTHAFSYNHSSKYYVQTPYRGFAPRPHWGTSVPRTSLLAIVYSRPLWGKFLLPPKKIRNAPKNSTRPKNQRDEFTPYFF